MVILSENPYQVSKENLQHIKVEQLLLQGKPYEPVKRGPIGQILKGMHSKETV